MHIYIIMSLQGVCLSSRKYLTGGVCPGFCVWKVLSGVVLSVPLLSEYIHYNRELNITFYFRFHMSEIFLKCDVTCSWTLPPLSQIVTPSQTPKPLEPDILHGRPLTYIIFLDSFN